MVEGMIAHQKSGGFVQDDSPEPGTYHTRVPDDLGAALSAYGELYSRIQRKLFSEVCAGRSAVSLKSAYLERYGIPARMFNGIRVSLDGKVSSIVEQQKLLLDDLQGQIARAGRQISAASEKNLWQQVHHKKRRLSDLKSRLAGLESDIRDSRIRLCFGSKRLWRNRHNLKANGYRSHAEWLLDWQEARSGEFFVLGSRDETGGCQLCVAAVADDGSLTLRLRMPDCLTSKNGKYLVIPGVRFAYGHDEVLAALESNAEYTQCRRLNGEKAARATDSGQALSYRFKRDGKGWRVFVSTRRSYFPVVTDRHRGAVGVDLNADHLAVSETDGDGNWLSSWRVPLVTYGKSSRQAEALIGDAVASVVADAKLLGKPIVIEKLDFRQKKAALEGESPKYSRMLSSFSYGKIKAYLISRGHREGVEVNQVNPAFSSVIGRVKFMERYGLSVHQAAALVLARRLLGCSERIPRLWACPDGSGGHVAFTVPVRKRAKHVWTYWGAVSGQLRPALAAQHRLGKRRRGPNPVQAVGRTVVRGGGLSGDPFGVPG